MTQEMMPTARTPVTKTPENVSEPWNLYDTVLVGGFTASMQFNTGYFTTFAAMGAANTIPFFNVRNRNHGLAYNNQETRDQLPYVFKIYTIGVSFFAPSTVLYRNNEGAPLGAQRNEMDMFETELPKHMSVVLQTNQDERLKIVPLMTPSGYGIESSGIAQGDIETITSYPPVAKASWNQGVPILTNRWGFRNPLEIPRRAALSVRMNIAEYARNMLAAMPGPFYQFFQSVAGEGAYVFKYGLCGIQVVLGGIREVQQRGQYHA